MYKKLLEFIVYVILITAMVMSLNMAIADSTSMNIKPLELLKYTFLIVLAAAIFIRLPATIIAAAAVLSGSGIYAYVNKLVIPEKVISYYIDFFNWLPQYAAGYEGFKLEYSLIFSILYIVLVTLTIALIVFGKRGYGALIVLGAAAFMVFWFTYVSKARLYLFYYLFAALILYSYNVYERKKLEWVGAESSIDKFIELKWIFNSFIIIVISILISQFVKLDIKPVQLAWLNDKVLQVFPFIEDWKNDKFDSYNFGFGSRYTIESAGYKAKRLGGPVKLSEKVMLVVETAAVDDIYLRGTVKDYYNGYSWEKTKKSSLEYNKASELPVPFAENAAYSKELTITHKGLFTSTVFAPNTLYRLESKAGRFFVDQDNEAVFPSPISRKDKYTVKTLVPYIDESKLRKQKAALVLETYLQLPDNIPDRVKQLAQDITANYDNDYDKAKAIEKYLRNNYSYTLTPSEVPKGSEFVDYFLFEGKEGYCTYFATAMAVLLRAVDIPSRYVEGFIAKYENSTIRNVRGTTAHTWVEINFGPYGWLTFEATPAYSLSDNRARAEAQAEPIPETAENEPASNALPAETAVREKNLDEQAAGDTAADTKQAKEISAIARIILAVVGILLLRVLYLLLKKILIELELRKSVGKQYSIYYFKDVLRYLKKINIRIENEETMREFWKRAKYVMGDNYLEGDEIIVLLEKLRYSNMLIDDSERKQLEEYRKKLKKYVTARLGAIKGILSYYVIGL